MLQPKVLIVEDDPALRDALCATIELAGFGVESADDGAEALAMLAKEPFQLVVSDIQMDGMDGNKLLQKLRSNGPDLPVVLMTAYGTIQSAVDAMRAGAMDYLVKPFDADRLVEMIRRYLPVDGDCQDIIAVDPNTQRAAGLARKVATSDATVMLTGESGVGKEVFARLIHSSSPRSGGPFVAINCAAIPENMLEASLFGYEKGAFTGAYQARPGKFEQANGGTLLLDEVSEMDLGLQAKLLRVLQEREVERLGGRETVQLDVRVLATTNRDMREEVAAGRFREDLFYRLNVFPINIPPLRERREDILPLARQLVQRYCRDGQPVPELGAQATAALLEHTWPGNVRELDNIIQRAMILVQGRVIETHDLCFEVAQLAVPTSMPDNSNPSAPQSERKDALGDDLKNREFQIILEALHGNSGNRKAVAEQLGISQRTLRYKLARMREQGITIPA